MTQLELGLIVDLFVDLETGPPGWEPDQPVASNWSAAGSTSGLPGAWQV